MKKIWLGALTAGLAWLLLSCGGGGGESTAVDARPFGPPNFGRAGSLVHGLIGLVVDANSGSPIPNVTVTAGSLTTTTDAQGNFTMPTIANGASVVSFTLAAYAPQSRTVQISPVIETSVIVQMVPNATTAGAQFDPAAAHAPTTVPGTPAFLALNAGILRKADGSLPAAGNATAAVTPIGPSLDAYLLPGEYVATLAAGGTGQFETFGAIDVRVTDSGGSVLEIQAGNIGLVRIPVNTRSAALPGTVALFRFDTATGLWVEDGVAFLAGTAPNQYYEGPITHLGTWAAGQAYITSNITVCVNDTNGTPVQNARVYSDGVDYSGGGTGWTNSAGVAIVPMKRSGQAIISANSPRSSNSATISAGQSASAFTLTPCLIMPTAGMTIRLTWGSLPTDLDSHLKGPNNTHIAYFSRGSLTSGPFAALDVDDVTSFGPEVITIARLTQGQHEYFVHNFSGTFSPGQTASPARVEVRVGSQIAIFRPGTGEGSNDYWRVFQFTVAGDCSVTINPLLNSWSATEPNNPAGSASGNVCN